MTGTSIGILQFRGDFKAARASAVSYLNAKLNSQPNMSRDISERDWKIFRELHKLALDRLCQQVLNEAEAEIEDATKSAHERYLRLFELIQKRDDDIARGFNDLRRSTALRQIGIIHSMGLFASEELQRFSPETLKVIELYGFLRET